MKKFKALLVAIALIIIFPCFCKADIGDGSELNPNAPIYIYKPSGIIYVDPNSPEALRTIIYYNKLLDYIDIYRDQYDPNVWREIMHIDRLIN